jgi:hypothetical protein
LSLSLRHFLCSGFVGLLAFYSILTIFGFALGVENHLTLLIGQGDVYIILLYFLCVVSLLAASYLHLYMDYKFKFQGRLEHWERYLRNRGLLE